MSHTTPSPAGACTQASTISGTIRYEAVIAEDAEALVAVRIAAMQPSLERIGRFDPQRARDRFLANFAARDTQWIVRDSTRLGFLMLQTTQQGLRLEHLYILPAHQSQGIGSAVLQDLFARADAASLALSLGALRGSAANHFYLKHGFIQTAESEWDIEYLRPCRSQALGPAFTPAAI